MKQSSRWSRPFPFSFPFALASVVAMLAVSLTAPVASSLETPTDTVATNTSLTLEALLAEVLANNPELKFYDAEIAAARAGRKTAGLLANPEVSGSVGQKRVTGGGLGAEGVAWAVSMMQPFEWPGRMGLRKAIANQDLELAQLGYARFKLALAGRVRTLAYGLFAAREKSEAATEVAQRFKALREVLVQRDPAGLTPLLETRVIEATELNAQRKASEALLLMETALLELNQLRGVTPDTHLSLSQVNLSFRMPEDKNTLLTLARTNNFEWRVRAVELAQQGFRVGLAKNERYPSISVGPTFSEEHAGNERERIIGLGVSLPLPMWNRNKGDIETAVARQWQAELSLHIIERDIQRKILEAALIYETKVREMSKWRPDSVQHFKEAAEVADRHYRLGAVPISTYVELQKQYLDAVGGLLDTKKEALEAAAQIELLTGRPLPLSQTTQTEEQK